MSRVSLALRATSTLMLFMLMDCANADGGEDSPILKLSARRANDERDITIRLTLRSLFLTLWLGFGIILLYEILSLWILFLTNRHFTRQRVRSNTVESSGTDSTEEAEKERRADQEAVSEPLPLVSRKGEKRNAGGTTSRRPPTWVVLIWGISTAYAIFYSFEMMFLYLNDRWYQLLGVQILLSSSDIVTWIHLVAFCKYGQCRSQALAQLCVGIKLLHVVFNLVGESRNSYFSVRHWMFLLEDTTCLWCYRHWVGVSPRQLLTIRGIMMLLFVAMSLAALLHNMTDMNRITRV